MKRIAAIACILWSAACTNDISHTDNLSEEQVVSPDTVAHVGDYPIKLNEIDQNIAIKLYELNEAIYQLRKNILQERISLYLDDNHKPGDLDPDINIYLTPPERPTLNSPGFTQTRVSLSRGNDSASITIKVFCSYQSVHCARLHPVLIKVVEAYPQLIKIHYYDFPQPWHRYAYKAAKALRCIGNGSIAQQFQDLLFAKAHELDESELLSMVSALNQDLPSYKQCVESQQQVRFIEANISLAQSLGITKVPAVIINKVYFSAPYTYENVSAYIESEFGHLIADNIKMTRSEPHSRLPIKLLGTSVSNNMTESMALVSVNDKKPVFFSVGDKLLTNVILKKINRDDVLVDHGGLLEVVRLWNGTQDSRNNEIAINTENLFDENSSVRNAASLLSGIDNKLPATTAVFRLSNNWLQEKLMDIPSLNQEIVTTEHAVDGVHLMKLQPDQLGEFFEVLGLEPNDVLMMVNQQWIHSDHNPLWDTLQNSHNIKLVVMRKGLPIVHEYQIDRK